jgi:signal transduction histidine kinase
MPRPTFSRPTMSIRSRVVLLLLAPLLPLLGMWTFSTSVSLASASNLLDAKRSAEEIALPTSAVVVQLQAERKMSAVFVTTGQTNPELKAKRAQVDRTIASLKTRTAADDVQSAASSETKHYLAEVLTAFEQLPSGRAAIDTRQYDRLGVMVLYDAIIDKAFALYESIAGIVDDHQVTRQANTVVALTEAREEYAREDALVSAVLADGGTFSAGERSFAVQQIGAQRSMYQIATHDLHPDDRVAYDNAVKGDPYQRLHAAENRIADSTRPMTSGVDAAQWNADWSALDSQLTALNATAANRVVASADPIVTSIVLRLALVGGLGLLIIIALVYLGIRLARSIIRRIADLRSQALEVAEHKLPGVVARLRVGETVDVDAEVPPIESAADELSQLAGAFTELQRTAVSSAVQEATLRAGLNQVFLNLGRRSQVLVHRQLSLLDAMERRVTDPQDLEELYRIDHLGARIRRHAEDLVILAGAVPGRGWRNPVPLHDVLRSAVSEVEEYTRITLIPLPELSLLGRAVNDVVHLLAELLENATAFSPQNTHVRLSGQLVPNGFAVEIEDRGVGLPPEAIEQANARLAELPDFDPAHSSRLGLFVVARLAARHGIRVTLRGSAYGGITAVALIPRELVVEESHELGELAEAPRITGPATVAALTTTSTAEIPPKQASAVATLEVPARSPEMLTAPQRSPEGLPMRQRPAPEPETPHQQAPYQETAERSPEATRSILSSLQAGSQRGRLDAQRVQEEQQEEQTDKEPT